jgi:ABC-type molybdate transport system substrate-binding protein
LRYLQITFTNTQNNFEFVGNAEIINNTDFRVIVTLPNNAPVGKYFIKRIDFADYWGNQVVANSFYNFSSFTREVEFNIG